MKLRHYISLVAVLAAGLSGSFFLIPGESELSLMYFRGHQFRNARQLYEKRLGVGDRSADVIMPLAELYVQAGEVGRAVNLLRQFRPTSGASLELFQRVATFQKYGQQMQEYLRTLEAISRIENSEDGLRELSNQYRYANQTGKLIPALEALIARYPGEPAEYLELANLLAVGGSYAAASGVLTRFEFRHPLDVTADTVELLISVLIDSSESVQALDRAARWVERHRDSGGVARLANLLRTKGQAAAAEHLLEPFASAIDGDPILLSEWLQQQITAGRTGQAFERLDRLRRRDLLPDDLTEPFLDLALARGDVGLAIDVAGRHGVHRLNDALLGMLAERALSTGREAFAFRLQTALGDRFLENRPLLAARLAYARGDRTQAVCRLQAAEADAKLSSADRLAVASMDATLGRQSEATAQLARITIETAPEDLMLEIARLYVTVGKSGEGADRFEWLRSRKSSPRIDRGWALAAAGAGRGWEVARWIEASPGRSIAEPLLRDLYFLAQDQGQESLALAVSQRLFLEHGGDANRLILAGALTAAGRPLDALPHVRSLLAHGQQPGLEEAYSAALMGAIRSAPGAAAEPLQAELRRYWTARLSQPGRDEREQLDLIYGLLELSAWDAALPHLEILARQRGELVPLYVETAVKSGHTKDVVAFLAADLARLDLSQETREARVNVLIERGGIAEALPYVRKFAAAIPKWIPVYEDALIKLERTGELVDFWRARLANGTLPADEKRAIGFKLIDAGQQGSARQVFAGLARTAPADHPDVAELLFLSGLEPGPEVLNWLEDRARHDVGGDRTAWLRLLLDAGGTDRVAAIVSATPPLPGQGGPLLEIYLRALAELNQVDVLAGAVTREAGATTDPERVRKLAGLVRDAGASAAEPAYSRLLALDPGDREALHWLGVFAYARARYSLAERHLSTLLVSSPGGYDDNFYYAELLWRKGNRSQSRAYYGRALRLIEGMASPTDEARSAHAQALFRCGYVERGLREYRTLVVAAPRNGELRADFGAMLLEARLYDEAEDVLSGGSDSGGVRMALLRAQMFSATARRSDALQLIRDLSVANPDSASVVASLGLIEQGVGRTRRAGALLDRALGMDAHNEDLRGSRIALDREREGPFRSEFESRRIQGAEREDLVRALGARMLSGALGLQFAIEQNRASIHSLRYADGHTGTFEGVRRRGEVALEWESDGGTRVKGSLFAGESAVGGGVAIRRPDPKGSSTIRLEMNQPNWDFQESLAQEGARDRIEVRRETVLSPSVSMRVGAAANRYSLRGAVDAARSFSTNGDVNIQVLRRPNIAVDYSFDGEYRLSTKTLSDAAGDRFHPLPLVSREVHSAMIHIEKQLTRGLRAEGAGGVAVDRLGGSAPFWTARMSYEASQHFGGTVEYDRRLYSLDSTRTVTTFRGGFWWRF